MLNGALKQRASACRKSYSNAMLTQDIFGESLSMQHGAKRSVAYLGRSRKISNLNKLALINPLYTD